MTEDTNAPGYGVEIHGPFKTYVLTSHGFKVPYIEARPLGNGMVDVILDGRFGLDGPVPAAELGKWLPLIANAMAIAAGYSSHGENSNKVNPYRTQIGMIAPPPPNLTVVPKAPADD